MKLISLTVKNWKSIKECNVKYHNLMVLIGENGSGKSSLLSAVLFILNPSEKINKDAIRDENLEVFLCGDFIDEHENHIQFNIIKNIKKEELTFLLKFDYHDKIFRQEKNLSYYEYKKYFSAVTIHHVGSISNANQAHSLAALLNEKAKTNIELMKSIYVFYEHPEAFLTPQYQRELFDSFVKLSKIGALISIETHSSSFVGLQEYHSICLTRKEKDESQFIQHKGDMFSGDEMQRFNMTYWIDSERSELFFAKKVILVEGQTDKMIIGYLGRLLNIFRYDYSIIECGNKGIIPQFIKLLNYFKIPYIAIYDKDNHHWRNKFEIINSNSLNVEIHSCINHDFGSYIEFENDIEEELYGKESKRKVHRNKPFTALKTVMNPNFMMPDKFAEKIKKIYS
ncbi:MAG: ATP-dependent nuclease [Fusobacteriaceae bacterium]